MPKFNVCLSRVYTADVTVEAATREEAEAKAYDMEPQLEWFPVIGEIETLLVSEAEEDKVINNEEYMEELEKYRKENPMRWKW